MGLAYGPNHLDANGGKRLWKFMRLERPSISPPSEVFAAHDLGECQGNFFAVTTPRECTVKLH
jgi:hypothetical protein